jgi:hypothetical protein
MELDRRTSLAVLSGVSLTLGAVLLFDVYENWARQGNTLVSTVAENALPFTLLAGLCYAVWRLSRDDYDVAFVGVVTKWTVVGAVVIGGLTAWVVGIQVVYGELKPTIIALQTTVVGAVTGAVVGHRTATVEQARDENCRKRRRFQSLFENDPSGIVDLRL